MNWNRVLGILGLLLLAGLAYLGLFNGAPQWSQAANAGQRIQTLAQIAYGGLGVVGVGAVVARRTWARAVLWGVVAAATVAAGLAPVVWGGTSWLNGAAAALGAFLISWLVLWLCGRLTGA